MLAPPIFVVFPAHIERRILVARGKSRIRERLRSCSNSMSCHSQTSCATIRPSNVKEQGPEPRPRTTGTAGVCLFETTDCGLA